MIDCLLQTVSQITTWNVSFLQLIDVTDHVNSSLLLDVVQQGPAAHLRPQPGKAQELVDALKDVEHMQVMLKEDIPEDKHYKNNRRVMEVFALADDGYQITRVRRLSLFR